ncbi:FecR family protein [Chitinophaga sp. GCM10012297]|uniref:FecR domain-containing protein n=1 Tax=Chitinophaga chungangae TaxID=2821488 RepID=A0ABS3YFN7_9BACT|nr:FecR domain-containing protein [Chitinophaga chungangae]MBO9153496.1 FecR domain-containing protein [Chitinophaga chungangae]
MQEDRFYHLMGRVLSGSASDPEAAELQQLIAEDERLRLLYWQMVPGTAEREEEEQSEALQAYATHFAKMQIAGLMDEAETPAPAPRRFRKALVMTVFLLALTCAGGWWYWSASSGQTRGAAAQEVKTPKGSQSYFTLADGTEVWLNSNSKITYGDDFNRSSRNVRLTGEAYFKVAKDEDMPFIIEAGGLKVKVLGTVFNIRSYPDEQNTETTLVSGSVAITLTDQPGNTIQLKPGEKLAVRNRISPVYQAQHNADSLEAQQVPILTLSKLRTDPLDGTLLDAGWKEGKLIFDGDNFGKVASKLEKWYNVTVVVENDALYNASFTGVFEKKSMTDVLNALQATGKITYSQDNDTVYVR